MCKSSNDQPQKIDLTNDKFEDIKIHVNDTESIEFDVKKWKPTIGKKQSVMSNITEEENDEESEKEGSQDNDEQDKKIIDSLKNDIREKDEKIEDLKNKIEEVKSKIEIMKKILNIDVSEQEYVADLTKKVNEEKNA